MIRKFLFISLHHVTHKLFIWEKMKLHHDILNLNELVFKSENMYLLQYPLYFSNAADIPKKANAFVITFIRTMQNLI